MLDFKLTFTLGEVVILGAGVGSVIYLWHALIRPLKDRLLEHDLLWDDYSRRHGLPFRYIPGRRALGEPLPEPPHIN